MLLSAFFSCRAISLNRRIQTLQLKVCAHSSSVLCQCVQTYLEQNEGPGLQHLALKTDDIFTTMRALKAASGAAGGFDFMAPASR